jgi:hypothetical protein
LLSAVQPAGLLARCERNRQGEPRLTFADEHGLFEVWLPSGVEPPQGMGAWTIRGRVEARHGVAVVTASRVERVLPAGPPSVRLFVPGSEAGPGPAVAAGPLRSVKD